MQKADSFDREPKGISLPREEAEFHSFCSALVPPDFPDLLTQSSMTARTLHSRSAPVARSAKRLQDFNLRHEQT